MRKNKLMLNPDRTERIYSPESSKSRSHRVLCPAEDLLARTEHQLNPCLTSELLLFWAASVATAATMRPWQPCTGFLWCAVLLPTLAGTTEFIRVWPEKTVVEFGGSVVINCSSNCDGIILESSLDPVPAGNGSTWKAFNIPSVSQWAPTLLCYAQCTSNINPPHAVITVYRAPEHVAMDPVPEMEVGKAYTWSCRVSNVAPIRNLTITLLKAGEKVLAKTFESHAEAKAGDAVLRHNVTAEQADRGKELTCHAALDLRPDGPLLEKTSSSEALAAVVFSSDPHLEAPLSMETNTTMAVHCHVSGVFPAEEAQFDLQFAGKSWNLSTSVSGSSVSAQALVSSSSTGEHTLLCTVSLGRVSRRVEKTVNVYKTYAGLIVAAASIAVLAAELGVFFICSLVSR
ncbi:intercellular adhesion molecule 1-like isoform X2 [Varanus komodoensis]|uniref:intercellular adhesion molecule 1-like isoform X2 n=1 Tax=Varanus komodoensis TaxID=61221 RepID=UPI001CF78DA3|nr:intercellular adhesion molecule 1-like isoform X2 [Varanus komodoensis]